MGEGPSPSESCFWMEGSKKSPIGYPLGPGGWGAASLLRGVLPSPMGGLRTSQPEPPSEAWLLFSCSVVSDALRPQTAARQASLSFTISQSLLKLISIESVMPSNHLVLCRPLLLPSIFPSIRVFPNELVLQYHGNIHKDPGTVTKAKELTTCALGTRVMLDKGGSNHHSYLTVSIVTVEFSSSHRDPALQGRSAQSPRQGNRERLRKAKPGAQATIQDSRGPAGDPGSPGPRPLWPLSQGHRSQLGSRRELLHQGLKQGPRPVHFQLGEWRPRHGEWAGPHSPRKTLIVE